MEYLLHYHHCFTYPRDIYILVVEETGTKTPNGQESRAVEGGALALETRTRTKAIEEVQGLEAGAHSVNC